MHRTVTRKTPTEAFVTIRADQSELDEMKAIVVKKMASNVSVAGFRAGKAPLQLVEKQLNQQALQTEVLEELINLLYSQTLREENLRPVSQPEVVIKKFVPFTTLEFEATVAVVGPITLPDYTKIKKVRPTVLVDSKDIEEVLDSLQARGADKKDVDRAAQNGDQVWINFKGTDEKGKPVQGADGQDYPILLGGNTFIPGFEENLIGLKPKANKSFTIRFPKDYGVKALGNKKVTFEVTLNKVQEVLTKPLDDSFARQVGPFKTLADLKADIKKQLIHEKQHQAERQLESEVVEAIADKSKVEIPDVLIEDQVESMLKELRQNLAYRGQTYQEFLSAEGTTDEGYKQKMLHPEAEKRVKASLVLSEIADRENIEVTPEELEVRLQLMKGQYKDPAAQAELDKPEARRDIISRLLTEKTLNRLVQYATK